MGANASTTSRQKKKKAVNQDKVKKWEHVLKEKTVAGPKAKHGSSFLEFIPQVTQLDVAKSLLESSASCASNITAGNNNNGNTEIASLSTTGTNLTNLSGSTAAETGRSAVMSFSVQGHRKDQDRFICVSLLEYPKVWFTGVFDGHGKDGDIIAEDVAERLPKYLREALLNKTDDNSTTTNVSKENVMDAIVEAYAKVQVVLDKEFEEQVVKPMEKLKKEIEEAQKIELPLSLPLGSGSTATTFLLHEKMMYVANVGDSRAVLCKSEQDDQDASKIKVVASDLTKDQNVANANKEELERIAAAGGVVCGRHLAGDNIDGMLQLTRSLGDVPLHRAKLVLHEPAIVALPITSDMLFCVAASDGLWDHFSSQEAVQFVYDRVPAAYKKAKADSQTRTDEMSCLLQVLGEVSRELEAAAAERAAAKGSQSDDVSVLIITLCDYFSC